MRKVIYTAIILLVFSLPYSCGGGCENTNFLNTVTELSLRFGTRTPAFDLRSDLPYDSAIFRVAIDEVIEEAVANAGFRGFANSAFAEDCAFNTELKNDLSAISITSNDAVVVNGEEYPEGTSLNELFMVIFSSEGTNSYTVEEIINFIALDSFYFSTVGDGLEFSMVAPPDEEINQNFIFNFDFEDRSISLVSNAVVITRD